MVSRSDITIREAGEADIEGIAFMGARFFDEAQWSDVVEWDHDSVCSTLRMMLSDERGILLVAQRGDELVGMAGGMVYPLYFNHNHLTGQELFWWVDPAFRGEVGLPLMSKMEERAMSAGAKSWAMIALDKVRPEATGAIYRRRGYRASEHSYIKRLAA